MILEKPEQAWALYVFGHGAGAGMRHAFMQKMAGALAAQGVATLRYEFPYMEQGKRRIDPKEVLEGSVREAVIAAAAQGLPLFAGGKSMGGRMTSQAQAIEPLPGVLGLAFFGFPLHPPDKPGITRAEHLRKVQLPMLFMQGTLDEFAELPRLKPVVAGLPLAKLHLVEGADHGFHVLKRSGRNDEEVIVELAEAFAQWARGVLST